MRRIKILDSLRGIAALIVVFHHIYTRFSYTYNIGHYPEAHRVLSWMSEMNREAVLFFFILSGFSIRLSLQKGMPVTKPLLNNYLFRRFNRIIPLYILAILLTVLTGAIIHKLGTEDFSIVNLLGNALFLQASKSYKGYWFPPYGDNGPFWSISFEMFYYLFFPGFIYGMMKIFRKRFFSSNIRILILFIAFIFSLVCILVNKTFFFPYIAFATLFYIWYLGFFLGELYMEKQIKFNKNLLCIIGLMLLSYCLKSVAPSTSIQMLFLGSVIGILFFLFYLARSETSKLFSILENVFNFLFYKVGRGSYALYLFHYPLIMIFVHYKVNSIWIIFFAMFILAFLCIIVEEYFVKKKYSIFKLEYLR